MLQTFRHIWSYVLGIKLEEYQSAVSGKLELWLVNGRKVLNSRNANYSFDSLHQVFQKAFRAADLRLRPKARVLILGFGCGSVAHILHGEYGFDCHITGVDADPLLFQIARKHFGIHPSEKLAFTTDDATLFMAGNDKTYDLIVVDLFVDDQVPEPFSHPSFIHNCVDALGGDGLFFMNVISNKRGERQIAEIVNILQQKGRTVKTFLPFPGNTVIFFRK